MSDPRTVTLDRETWAALLKLVDRHPAELPRDQVVAVRASIMAAVILGRWGAPTP